MSSWLKSSQLVYSVRKDFTGLATPAFIAWKPTVNTAMSNARTPDTKNIHQLIDTRYAKSSSHLCIAHHAMGNAITEEISTSFKKSTDSIRAILLTDAPNTLRMTISLTRCSAAYVIKPNKPRQAITMANTENVINICPVLC